MTQQRYGKPPTGATATAEDPFAAPGHDHRRCQSSALETAEAVCRRVGARLTPQRRRVLELIWSSHAPVGAYELLERLREEGVSAAPPTVYRALEFLQQLGLVHRIESLNAYVGCPMPAAGHRTQFLICETCGNAAELDDAGIAEAVESAARRAGFAARHGTVELFGTCPDCRTKAR